MNTRSSPSSPFSRFASRLRFPQLFWLTLTLFLVDLLIPDLIPFVDELLLGLLALFLANWRKQKREIKLERRFQNAKPVKPEDV